MALRKLERRNYGGKWLVRIKYQNLHSFKEGLILLCQGILQTRRITHLHCSVHLTIPLKFENGLKKLVRNVARIKYGFAELNAIVFTLKTRSFTLQP